MARRGAVSGAIAPSVYVKICLPRAQKQIPPMRFYSIARSRHRDDTLLWRSIFYDVVFFFLPRRVMPLYFTRVFFLYFQYFVSFLVYAMAFYMFVYATQQRL